MEPSEAREHLELVDRVLSQTDRRVYTHGEFFIAWGIVGVVSDLIWQLVLDRVIAPGWLWLFGFTIACAIVFSVIRGRAIKADSDYMPRGQQEYLNVLWLAIGVTVIAQVAANPLFPGWSSAGLWTVAAAIVTGYIGLHGDRRGSIAAFVLLASLVWAAYAQHSAGYILAVGYAIGYIGFGIVSLLARE
jgi:hypothetical protein